MSSSTTLDERRLEATLHALMEAGRADGPSADELSELRQQVLGAVAITGAATLAAHQAGVVVSASGSSVFPAGSVSAASGAALRGAGSAGAGAVAAKVTTGAAVAGKVAAGATVTGKVAVAGKAATVAGVPLLLKVVTGGVMASAVIGTGVAVLSPSAESAGGRRAVAPATRASARPPAGSSPRGGPVSASLHRTAAPAAGEGPRRVPSTGPSVALVDPQREGEVAPRAVARHRASARAAASRKLAGRASNRQPRPKRRANSQTPPGEALAGCGSVATGERALGYGSRGRPGVAPRACERNAQRPAPRTRGALGAGAAAIRTAHRSAVAARTPGGALPALDVSTASETAMR